MKSPEPRAKGDVDIRGGNYSKGLNKQDINLTDRLLADLRTTARRREADRVEEFTLVTSKQTKKRKITEEGE